AAKISDLVGVWVTQANISPLLLGWGIAALVRIATGSATVATITATGLVAQIVERDPSVSREFDGSRDRLGIVDPLTCERCWILASERILRTNSG
ncbi:MAG TPA: hypothetical protein VIH54_07240, partial [Chthoniobacterales bacterium]